MVQADLFDPENRIDHVEIAGALRSTWYEVAGDRRSGAVFDPTRRYRYSLWRVWERRSPKPEDLWEQDDPVGPLNDKAIQRKTLEPIPWS